jgi:hypothetical protein
MVNDGDLPVNSSCDLTSHRQGQPKGVNNHGRVIQRLQMAVGPLHRREGHFVLVGVVSGGRHESRPGVAEVTHNYREIGPGVGMTWDSPLLPNAKADDEKKNRKKTSSQANHKNPSDVEA